jgi:hypothetical protein
VWAWERGEGVLPVGLPPAPVTLPLRASRAVCRAAHRALLAIKSEDREEF